MVKILCAQATHWIVLCDRSKQCGLLLCSVSVGYLFAEQCIGTDIYLCVVHREFSHVAADTEEESDIFCFIYPACTSQGTKQ